MKTVFDFAVILRALRILITVVILATGANIIVSAQDTSLSITSPSNRLVYQRNHADKAIIPIEGICSLPRATVEARLIDLKRKGKPGRWRAIGSVQSDGSFRGKLVAKAGWYGLEVRARTRDGATTSAAVDRVGIGEVFLVVGHSVAQGGDINLPGAEDDRVNTIGLDAEPSQMQRDYEKTADSRYLPPAVGTHFATGVRPAPFGHGTYFWAKFGEHVARAHDVPVLILNAGFGGTSLEHWAKSARGESFEHSFVKSSIRMPYINVSNTLQRYVSLTGVRVLLADQGQNDAGQSDDHVVFSHYKAWVDQTRKDLGFSKLAIVVNRQTPPPGRTQIRRAQERMIQEQPHCFPGPDYDRLAKEDRYDNIHLSQSGAEKAAQFWADALNAAFFRKSIPYQPKR